MAKNVDESWPEHPLFPAEEGEDPHRVEFIQVVRYESGRALLVPTTFRSGELTSLDQLNSQYGGGLYELIGRRCSIHDPTSMGRISAKVRYEIAGPSRPLVVDPNAPPPAPTMPAVVHQHNPSAPDNSVMGILTMMLANSRDEARAARELQQQIQAQARTESMQAQQNMMQMQTTMMSGMLGVVTALAGNKGGGGIDDISKMASLFKDLGVLGGKPAGEESEVSGESIGEMISNAADIVQGMVELKTSGGLGPGVASTAPAGSAAAVLGANPPAQQPAIK